MKLLCLTLVIATSVTWTLCAGDILFQDEFRDKLGPGWSWVREHREAWRVTKHGLEVRIEPGNMWGPRNDARNLLVRPAPDTSSGEIEVGVKVENHPTNQYEQTDLVWYYDDSNMVKIGQEIVDGKLSVVMGREENDKTHTLAIIPLESTTVWLRLFIRGNQIRSQFRTAPTKDWREVGQCDLPAPKQSKAKLSLEFYQGQEQVEHWARVTEFRVVKAD
jgi:regulation of enolase protein 1 (concanavalin A-like superfamily)